MTLRYLLAAILLAWAVFLPCDAAAQSLADQPQAQRDAVRQILDLGGDWESGRQTVLIGFIGTKFTNDTFPLLTPLVDLKRLALFEIPADDRAFVHCAKLEKIESLQMDACKFSGVGLKHLVNCKQLKNVDIEETPITDEGLAVLAKFTSIESLQISHSTTHSRITSAGVRTLKTLTKLKHLSLDLSDLPEGLEQEMTMALPNCEVSLHVRKPRRQFPAKMKIATSELLADGRRELQVQIIPEEDVEIYADLETKAPIAKLSILAMGGTQVPAEVVHMKENALDERSELRRYGGEITFTVRFVPPANNSGLKVQCKLAGWNRRKVCCLGFGKISAYVPGKQ